MIADRLAVLAILFTVSINTSLASGVWILHEDGIGPVKVGMSLSQLSRALHEEFSMPEEKSDQACFYVHPAKHADISFMIENGRLARIDVEGRGTATAEGIRVGDSESRALQVYGPGLKVEEHQYTGPGGHYLTLRSSNGRYGIRLETDKGKIERFYAGRFEAVQYVEGCL